MQKCDLIVLIVSKLSAIQNDTALSYLTVITPWYI